MGGDQDDAWSLSLVRQGPPLLLCQRSAGKRAIDPLRLPADYASDKDTGRYWEAGAANVHWVIVTDDQVERGIKLALERVKASGVLIEGNSFLKFIEVDFAVLVASDAMPEAAQKLKSSTRWAFQKASALYLSNPGGRTQRSSEIFRSANSRSPTKPKTRKYPYEADDFLNSSRA